MGGTSFDDDWELTSSSNEVRTVVLVGKTGNGKSATGNSIIGKEVFKSKLSSSGVTSSCERHTTTLKDGQTVNVIDTPGLFDISARSEFISKEIVNCLNLAEEGIHAIIVVFSVRARFSKEEETTLRSLQTLFGEKIFDYMIVVFTGGDDLERSKQTLEDYIGSECPQPLKDILNLCANRCVLFNNYAEDERKRFEQVQQLLSFVNMVLSQNGGQPYTDEFLTELKKGATKLHNQREVDSLDLEGHSNEEIFKRITEMIESKLTRLEQQLKEERAARLKAEENANKKMRELKEHLEEEHRERDELREHLERAREELRKHDELREQLERAQEELRKRGNGGCVIL